MVVVLVATMDDLMADLMVDLMVALMAAQMADLTVGVLASRTVAL